MKNFMILTASVLVAVVGVNCHLDKGLTDEMKKTFAACLKKLDVSKGEFMNIVISHETSNSKLRCLSECLLTENGILVDGEIEFEKVNDLLKTFDVDIPEAEVKKVHEKCVAEAEEEENICDFAKAYQFCFMKDVHKRMQKENDQ